MTLLDRLIVPGLALGAALATLLAGMQWRRAEHALVDLSNTRAAFADYRGHVQRNAAETSQKARIAEQKTRFLQQEALDAEHLARVSAEAVADRLRASHGQLQRYATDLATSFDRRGGQNPAAASGRSPADAAGHLLADMFGRLDEAAADIAQYADSASRAGGLCERSYDALIE